MTLRSPPLRDAHVDRGADLTEFGGWEMPVTFDSIREEHEAVRESVGKFDVSHMGEIEVAGPDAAELTNRLTTNDVDALDPAESHYSAITDEDGILLDDTLVYRLEDRYLFIPNAGHDEQMEQRWVEHRDEWGLDATVENVTDEYGMIAVQGPDAEDLLADAAGDSDSVRALDMFDTARIDVAGVECLVSRTGYTGEDGFELLPPWDDTETVWAGLDCQPCGLGARDTLRTEKGFLLSGQDFHPEENPRNPFEAGIGFIVKLDTEFVGRDALQRVHEEGVDETFAGFVLVDRGIPRHGYPIHTPDGEPIGEVTSGTMSPTLGESIGLGYLPPEYAEPDTELHVVIRGEPKKAKTRATPFV